MMSNRDLAMLFSMILIICSISYFRDHDLDLLHQKFTQSPEFVAGKGDLHVEEFMGIMRGFSTLLIIAGGVLGWVIGDSGWCCSCRERPHNDSTEKSL